MKRFIHFKLLCFKPNMQLIKRSRNAIICKSNKAGLGRWFYLILQRQMSVSFQTERDMWDVLLSALPGSLTHTQSRDGRAAELLFFTVEVWRNIFKPPQPLLHNSDTGSVRVITPASNEGVQQDLPDTGVQQSCVLDSHRCSRTPDPPLRSPMQPFLLISHYFAFYMKDGWRLMSKRFFLSGFGLSCGAVRHQRGL